MSRIKVLHLIKSLGRGGAEMLLPETLAVHDKNKFEFHYIYFLPWKNQVVPEIEKNDGKVKCINAVNNLRIILSAGKIATYIKENNIDIIHCHLPWAGIVGRIAGKKTGKTVLYTEHNKWERYHKLTYMLNKLTFSWQKIVIPCSYEVASSIVKHYKKSRPEIITIPNGVNTEKFSRENVKEIAIQTNLNIPPLAYVIGIVSVFRTQKRLDIWLEVAKRIHEKNKNTFFIIVGDGPLNSEIRAKAKSMEIDDYVHFVGLQAEVRPYLKKMDIFMMTSEFEGLPIALLEAMSMNCIPACTAAGGISEVVVNDHNGILVPLNEPQQLVDAVSLLLDSPEKMDAFKKQARIDVREKHGMKVMVERLENLYRIK